MRKLIAVAALFILLAADCYAQIEIAPGVSLNSKIEFVKTDTLGVTIFVAQTENGVLKILSTNSRFHSGIADLFRTNEKNLQNSYTGFVKGMMNKLNAGGTYKITQIDYKGFKIAEVESENPTFYSHVLQLDNKYYVLIYEPFIDGAAANEEKEIFFNSLSISGYKPGEQFDEWNLNYSALGALTGKIAGSFIAVFIVLALIRIFGRLRS